MDKNHASLDKGENYAERNDEPGERLVPQTHNRAGNLSSGSFVCNVEGCTGRTAARGLCWKHYMRMRRNGSTSLSKRRYNLPPKCRYCGTRRAEAFYRQYKSICKRCKKLRAITQRRSEDSREASLRLASFEEAPT